MAALSRPFLVFWMALLSLACVGVAAADDAAEQQIDSYTQALQTQLPQPAAEAVHSIEGTPRRLLAMRSYLRAGEKITERWSWSAEQIESYGKSREYRQLVAEVSRVRERFERANPGYTLYANTQVRSLDTQLQRWNANRTVGKVADALHRAVKKELKKHAYPQEPNGESLERLAAFLEQWRPPTLPPLAAPGLSLHGQLRAIDFQIMKDGAIVAPTDTATVKRNWDAPGWTQKLQAATEGTRFRGPLQSPYEPWHYEYDP